MSPADLPAALRLTTHAGWNQIEVDWRRLLAVWPKHCFAGRSNGRLVATVSLATYGTALGWLGMLLVDQEHRHRGYGAAMLQTALAAARNANVKVVGLDATDLGRPIYVKQGFVDTVGIDRWAANRPPADLDATVPPLEPAQWSALATLDREATGFDRGPLLARLKSEAGVCARVIRTGGDLHAYGLLRPGRTASQIGPVIATTPEDAAQIIQSLCSDAGPEPVLLDVPRYPGLPPLLERAGFRVSRRLTRMMLPANRSPTQTPARPFVACGFELG